MARRDRRLKPRRAWDGWLLAPALINAEIAGPDPLHADLRLTLAEHIGGQGEQPLDALQSVERCGTRSREASA